MTPLHRAWAFGEALLRAADAVPERSAIVGTGGIGHGPATSDSGKVNVAWGRDFLVRWSRSDKTALLRYADAECYLQVAQSAFEFRTFVAVAAAARGAGMICYPQWISIFAVSCTIGVMDIV